MDLVDQGDPAFAHIAVALQRRRDREPTLTEEAIKAAIEAGRAEWARVTTAPPESIVYYVRRAHLIKIGTTIQPHARFSSLLPDEIVAWEPGDRRVETERHQQFRTARLGQTEYFTRNPDLDEHMDALRVEHGAPDPTWPTLDSVTNPPFGHREVNLVAQSSEAVTVAEGAERLGVVRATIYGWVHRKRIKAVGADEKGRALYLLDHMRCVAEARSLTP